MKLSIVIPTKNESRNIARAISSFADLVARGALLHHEEKDRKSVV